MRKLILALFLANTVVAQTQRLILYEHFTGENCGPCAAVNPGLQQLMENNEGSIIKLTYQVNIPSAGPIYNENPSEVGSRRSYHSISSAPTGVCDGNFKKGNPSSFTQNDVNNRSVVPSPFNLSVSHNFNALADSIDVLVLIEGTQQVTFMGNKVRLRLAMIEEKMEYDAPPGTNGERIFYNVMRKMIPNPAGTNLNASWGVGQFQSFSFKVALPSYIRDKSTIRVIAFIQDDEDKQVHQAAISSKDIIPLDIRPVDLASNFMVCDGSSFIPKVDVNNNGSIVVTSCNIEISVNNTVVLDHQWVGSLNPGETKKFTLPAIPLTQGSKTLQIKTKQPNGGVDLNERNDAINRDVFVNTAIPAPLDYQQGFETATFPPSDHAIENPDKGARWTRFAQAGASGSASMRMDFFNSPEDQIDNFYIKRLDLSSYDYVKLEFMRANAGFPFQNYTTQDRLDIEVTSDCGVLWRKVYSKQGPDLTTAPNSSSAYVPTSGHWRKDEVTLDDFAGKADVLIRFKAISDYGNNLFIDDINIVPTSTPNGYLFLSSNEEANVSSISIYPNPANNLLIVEWDADKQSDAVLVLLDQLGRNVLTQQASSNYGQNKQQLNVGQLPTGIYMLNTILNGKSNISRISINH